MSSTRWLQRTAAMTVLGLSVSILSACGADGSSDAEKLTACPAEPDVAKANDEGGLVVYTTVPEAQEDRMVEAFNERYPDLKVTVVRGAGELPERIGAEARSGSDGADVFTFSDPAWFDKNEKDTIELGGTNVEAWPDEFWQVDNKAALSSMAPFGMIVWNTEKFPEGFETWEDLLAPEVKGQIGTRSDLTAAYAGFIDFMNEKLGDDYVGKLAAQKPKFYTSAVPMVQAVASGEIGVTNLSVPIIVSSLQDSGAPIEAVVPEPGYGIAFASGVLKNAHRPNAACLYVDFILSEEGQEAYNGDGLGASALDGIEGALSTDGLNIFESERYTPERLAEMETEFNQTFE
jgi:iron(III) transport system substrate-binding protein